MRAILFDVDGTLLRTQGAGMDAMKRAAHGVFGRAWRWEGISAAGHLDTLIFAEAAAINGHAGDAQALAAFKARYLVELATVLTEPGRAGVVMPGVPGLMEALRARDVTVGLLTGNFAAAVPIKFRSVGLAMEPFSLGVYAEDGPDRPSLVRHGLDRLGVEGQELLIIGDTLRDVHAAKAHGARCLAVATGGETLANLRASEADRAVADLSDPACVLDML